MPSFNSCSSRQILQHWDYWDWEHPTCEPALACPACPEKIPISFSATTHLKFLVCQQWSLQYRNLFIFVLHPRHHSSSACHHLYPGLSELLCHSFNHFNRGLSWSRCLKKTNLQQNRCISLLYIDQADLQERSKKWHDKHLLDCALQMNTNEYKWKQAKKKSGCNTLRPKFHQNQVSSNLPSIDATFPVVSVELPSNIKTTYDDKNSDTVKTSYTCIFRVILANTVTNSALWSAMRSALWLWPMMVRWRSNWQAMQGLDHRLAGMVHPMAACPFFLTIGFL